MVTRGSCDDRRAPSLYQEIAGQGNTLLVTCNIKISLFFLSNDSTLQLSFSLRPATTFFEWPAFNTGAATAKEGSAQKTDAEDDVCVLSC